MRKLALFAGLLALTAMSPATASAAEAPTCPPSCMTEYPVPIPAGYNGPFGIAKGLGDDMWFGDQDTIGRIYRHRNFTEHAVPPPGAAVGWVARGSDGDMWFTERNASKIGRMDTSGSFTEYSLAPGSSPQRIAAGPCGALWLTELAASRVGRTTGGDLTEYPLEPGSVPVGIAVASGDPAGWIVEFGSSKVARMALDGTVTNEFATPAPAAAPLHIAAGSNRALWFTESFLSPAGSTIGRLGPCAAGQS